MTLQRHRIGKGTRLPLITWTVLGLLCIGTRARENIDYPLKYSRTFMRGGESSSPKSMKDLLVLFSDVDGTIVHYPDDVDSAEENILKLPPSSTGLRGIISAATLAKFSSIRKSGVKVVLISGMRTATLLKRLPYLPKADAYCCEAGGRIFYPTRNIEGGGFSASPQAFDGADPADLSSYGLVEDMDWRHNMENLDHAGKDGFVGNELDSADQAVIALEDRTGLLWSYACELQVKGFVLDTKGYSTCFRVNRRHQNARSDEEFDSLARGEMEYPPGLATSTNLGAVDFYPSSSGKKRCCEYLARKFSQTDDENALAERCVCLCDDDNDVEMALSCLHAFIPSLSSDSMRETILNNEDKFTATFGKDIEGTRATEVALDLVLERTKKVEYSNP